MDTSLAVLLAMEVASQLDMEARSPERGSLHWYRSHRVVAMVDPSPLDLRAWSLEDPLVEVVNHLSELDPSHVQASWRTWSFCCLISKFMLHAL